MPALRARRRCAGIRALNALPRGAPRIAALLIAAAASLAGAFPVAAATSDSARFGNGSDRFVAGAAVTERTPVDGDLFAAGGSVDVDAPIGGDAVVAGGKVRLGANVGHTLYAAGGQLSLLGRVGHNARLAGGQVQVEPSAHVAGNLTVAGGRVELRGTIGGTVGAGGRHVLIDAKIGGDVDVGAGTVVLGPDAQIDGNLRSRSGEALQRDPAAQVGGTVERLGPGVPAASDDRTIGWVGSGIAVLWTIGLTLLAAIAVALLPHASASISRALHERPGWALMLGFVVLVCTPIAVVLSFATIIGIPLGLLVLLVYLMLLPLAWIASAIGIGDWFASRLPTSQPDRVARRVVAAALAVVLLAFLARVPWVGGWIAFVVLIAGLGALTLQLQRLLPR